MSEETRAFVPCAETALRVVRGTTRSWEQDPRPFAGVGEEDLRSILLSALNGAFAGLATAESFNGRGKTDIMVRTGSDNVLLAECKMYNGPAGLAEAITQLLGYAGWRDRDLCLLVFVRSAAISTAAAALRKAARLNPYVDDLEKLDPNGAEVLFHGHAPDDPGRGVTVRSLLVHIKLPRPANPASKTSRRPKRPFKAMHPDDLTDFLLKLKRSVPPNDGVEYTPTLDPAGAARGPARGWSTTWSRVTPDGSAGVHAAPLTEQSMIEHGPEGAAIAPDDDTARGLHEAIRRVHRDLVRVEVTGVGFRLDRVAGALRDAADRIERARPEHLTIVYGPRGLWQTKITIESDDESITEPMAFALLDSPLHGWDLTLRATLYDAALTISLTGDTHDLGLGWELLVHPACSAVERLASLRLVRAFRRGGRLAIVSIEPDFGSGDFALDPDDEPDEEFDGELALWEDVVALQDHIGFELTPPQAPEKAQEWILAVHSVASSLRTCKARILISPGVFRVAHGTRIPDIGEILNLPVAMDVLSPIGDTVANLGVGHGVLAARITDTTPGEDCTIVGYAPATDEAIEVDLVSAREVVDQRRDRRPSTAPPPTLATPR